MGERTECGEPQRLALYRATPIHFFRSSVQNQRATADNQGMPGTLHQGLLALLRDDPWLPFDLLGVPRPACGTPTDSRAELDCATDRLDRIRARYPDLVLMWRDPKDKTLGMVLGVEAHGYADRKKRWRLAGYHGGLADLHELNTWMCVLSFCREFSAMMRSWAVGPPPRIDAMLLDVETVPPPDSPLVERPTATVLAAALHGRQGNIEAACLGIAACEGLPADRRRQYLATILAAVPKPLRDTVIGELNVQEPYPLWEIERQSGTYQVGMEEGRRVTLMEMILALLEVRGVLVQPEVEAAIRSCESLTTLQRWARAAREVDDAAALLA